AALEWPSAHVRSIACGTGAASPYPGGPRRPAPAIAGDILRELTEGGPDDEVALPEAGSEGGDPAQGCRRVRWILPAEVRGGSGLRLGRGDVVVVTGGGRGVTAACSAALAQASPGACFVLLGRSALADEPEHLRGLDDPALARALGPEIPQPAALRER